MKKFKMSGLEDEQFPLSKPVIGQGNASSFTMMTTFNLLVIGTAISIASPEIDNGALQFAPQEIQNEINLGEVEQDLIQPLNSNSEQTEEKAVLTNAQAQPDVVENKPSITLDAFGGVDVYEVEGYGHVAGFGVTGLYMAEIDEGNTGSIGYIEHDILLDKVQLKYHHVIDGQKTHFWANVDSISILNQLAQNTPELIDYAVEAKKKYEQSEKYPKVHDLAFFPKEPVDFKRDGNAVTVTFKQAAVKCSANLEDTKLYSTGTYNTHMVCKPL